MERMLSPYMNDLLNQPQALRDTINGLGSLPSLVEFADNLAVGAYTRVLLTGMGSSFHALIPLRYRLIQHGVSVEHMETSELIHYAPALLGARTLLVAVSQSGQSAEVVRLLELTGKDMDIIGVTNTPDSPLGQAATHVVPTWAGDEFTVSCKTYQTGLAALVWLGDQLLTQSTAQFPDLAHVPDLVENYLKGWQEHVAALKSEMKDVTSMYLVGRGDSLATVGTGGLIIKEAAHFPAEGMSAAAFRHGPLESVTPHVFVLIFRGAERTVVFNEHLLQDVLNVGGRGALVQESNLAGVFDLPFAPAAAHPILEILPVEMFTLALAELKGHTAGEFSRGGKVTLVE